MDNKVIFNMFKNIIIEQNKALLRIIADKYDIDYEYLERKYLVPANYLPVVVHDVKPLNAKPIE
jgi:hypothetical protein